MRHSPLPPLAQKLPRNPGWLRRLRRLSGLAVLLVAACGGYPDGLVVVHVDGLLPNITELYITMQLDGTPATNTRPSPALNNNMAFAVTYDLTRFGVEVPAGTQSVSLKVLGYDTVLDVVRSATSTLDLSQGKDFSVTLTGP